MPKILNIIRGRGSRGNPQKMLSSLTQKTPWVQVEVENSKIRFLSRLSLGSGGVLMTKPKTLDKKILQTEGWIRISPIPATSEELALIRLYDPEGFFREKPARSTQSPAPAK